MVLSGSASFQITPLHSYSVEALAVSNELMKENVCCVGMCSPLYSAVFGGACRSPARIIQKMNSAEASFASNTSETSGELYERCSCAQLQMQLMRHAVPTSNCLHRREKQALAPVGAPGEKSCHWQNTHALCARHVLSVCMSLHG